MIYFTGKGSIGVVNFNAFGELPIACAQGCE